MFRNKNAWDRNKSWDRNRYFSLMGMYDLKRKRYMSFTTINMKDLGRSDRRLLTKERSQTPHEGAT